MDNDLKFFKKLLNVIPKIEDVYHIIESIVNSESLDIANLEKNKLNSEYPYQPYIIFCLIVNENKAQLRLYSKKQQISFLRNYFNSCLLLTHKIGYSLENFENNMNHRVNITEAFSEFDYKILLRSCVLILHELAVYYCSPNDLNFKHIIIAKFLNQSKWAKEYGSEYYKNYFNPERLLNDFRFFLNQQIINFLKNDKHDNEDLLYELKKVRKDIGVFLEDIIIDPYNWIEENFKKCFESKSKIQALMKFDPREIIIWTSTKEAFKDFCIELYREQINDKYGRSKEAVVHYVVNHFSFQDGKKIYSEQYVKSFLQDANKN